MEKSLDETELVKGMVIDKEIASFTNAKNH